MTYDPQYHDPELDTPFTCEEPGCGFVGTREDCDRVVDSYLDGATLGIICPWCRLVQWQDDDMSRQPTTTAWIDS